MTLRDDLGRTVALDRPAARLISLSPATTENLFALDAGSRIVGATAACDFPASARRLPRVGDFTRPSYERLLALHPDLVVFDSATVTAEQAKQVASRLRCPLFVQRSQRLRDVPRHLRELGSLVGCEAAAKRQAERVEVGLRRAPRRRGAQARRVFVEVSEIPLYAASARSFVGELVALAGGVCVPDGPEAFPALSREALWTLAPEVYIVAGTAPHPLAPPLDRLPAARAGRVVAIPPDLLFRPTPRLLDGLERLRAILD